ncbi:MAG: hypothetical protein VKJ44_01755 [Synechococcus sp.]|nr:hypothetical protein [Synechococcus sp.]
MSFLPLPPRPADRMALLLRKPRRITITISARAYEQLERSSQGEGRSMSNLAAFLLEGQLQDPEAATGATPSPATTD